MKKFITLILLGTLSMSLFAQMPVSSKIKDLGLVGVGIITQYNPKLLDTLKSADTLFYKIGFNHTYVGYPYFTYAKKVVAVDTTTDVIFYQSVNGKTNWIQVQSTTSPSNYSTTIAKSATGGNIDFWSGIIWFQSQYLGIRFIQRSKTGSKIILDGTVRFNNY